MKIETFELERIQSLWENQVKYNLTESGIHPYSLKELFSPSEIEELLNIRMGYGQTNGSVELRETISRLYSGSHADNFLVTNGSAEANFIAMWNLLEPGDEILIMVPNYMQMWGITHSLGVLVKSFHLREHVDWEPDPQEIKDLTTSQTKMIIICNPNNPTGAVLSEEIMREIVLIAKKSNAWIYADEIYRGAELSGEECPSFWTMYDKVLVSGGLSKSYAMPGLRIGWLAGPQDTIEKAWAYHDYTTIATNILSNHIAAKVLQADMRRKILKRNREILNENLTTLREWVNGHDDLFHFIPPKAGAMAFMRYNFDTNSTFLATKLREDHSVFIIPGDCFGMDGYIRLGIGSEKRYFLQGLKLIDKTLREIANV